MGLFNKKKKEQASESNEINNKSLKENIANTAFQLLKEGEEYNQLAHTLCEFGYLFMIEGHGVEALFKLQTDKGVYYFAAQGNSLMRLDINEAFFEDTTETFLSLHDKE